MKTPITFDSLVEFGMTAPTDGSEILFPLEKVLNENLDVADGDKIAICVSRENNSHQLCLKLPGGDTLWLLGAEHIEELQVIEKCITSFEPNY